MLHLGQCCLHHPGQLATALQGKKRKDTVCIVLADDTVEEAKIRMNKAGAASCCITWRLAA